MTGIKHWSLADQLSVKQVLWDSIIIPALTNAAPDCVPFWRKPIFIIFTPCALLAFPPFHFLLFELYVMFLYRYRDSPCMLSE
jgi:hypothetical protein